MTSLVSWWDRRSGNEKLAIGIVVGVVVAATGGAVAYAIATGGIVVVTGETMILVGVATRMVRAVA
jgi:hypothetical protein